MHSVVKPNDWVILKLPSGLLKIIQIEPDTVIYIPKLGSFYSNHLIDRPYHVTYEFLDKEEGQTYANLRMVPASEIHADVIAEENDASNPEGASDELVIGEEGMEFQLVSESGEVVMKTNREIIDDAARQTLTMEEIDDLKKNGNNAGKDLIAKLMLSHTGLDQKTSFSLAKYKLLKTKKFLRQFAIYPLDVSALANWWLEEKDAARTLELRDEAIGLTGCWANVHCASDETAIPGLEQRPQGRWLVVDETGGLVVAALAERMGLLFPEEEDSDELEKNSKDAEEVKADEPPSKRSASNISATKGHMRSTAENPDDDLKFAFQRQNTLTLIHGNAQPNLSLLKYFNYNVDAPQTNPPHPLSTHLHTISWLQLLHPEDDVTYGTHPPSASYEEMMAWNRGKRSNYFRKRRRWAKTRAIVDDTRKGGFDGLIIASSMDLTGVLRACVPLLRGGAHVAVYSPAIEPLAQLADLYSMSRRTAFISAPPADFETEYQAEEATESSPTGENTVSEVEDHGKGVGSAPAPTDTATGENTNASAKDPATWPGNEDFPLNPTLLLNVTVQTSRARQWQVLPGRTHPMMMSKGGAEGYLLTAVRAIPAKGRVTARGKYAGKPKKRRINVEGDAEATGDSEATVQEPQQASA